MNRDEVGAALGAWANKSKAVEDALSGATGDRDIRRTAETFAQLNFKVPQSMKSRIKQLAARDSITLLAMLYHMVDLYESKHGDLGSR